MTILRTTVQNHHGTLLVDRVLEHHAEAAKIIFLAEADQDTWKECLDLGYRLVEVEIKETGVKLGETKP